MKKSLQLLDEIIEIEKELDKNYRAMAHSLHKSGKTLGESMMAFHLRALRELMILESSGDKHDHGGPDN